MSLSSSVPNPPARSGFPRAALLILGLAVGMMALSIGTALIRARWFNLQADVQAMLIQSSTRWLLYAALAPVLGLLVARRPLERGRVAGRWLLHLVALTLFAFGHSVAMAGVYRLFHVYPRGDSIGRAIGLLALQFFPVNFVIFSAISGVYHAMRYHVEAVKRGQLAAGLRARLVESQLEALRAQLNPHFLFNTLNAASTLVLTGEREEVVRMLSRLSDLLRVSLDRGMPQEIPLAAELELLDAYLEIQRSRFGNRLTVVRAIAEEARAAHVPSMLLQPLVENALRHGIETRPGPGRVTLAVGCRDGNLEIRVEDSGPGFGPTAADPQPSRNGIGLANTRARLEQLYGARQAFECGNLAGGGAFVRAVLPFHTDAHAPEPPLEPM